MFKALLNSIRYKFRPPRYFRGPLHPYQPPPPTDIHSREFVPGPFTQPRLQETYQSTIASDVLTLAYTHITPGTPEVEHADRLRPWIGENPYFKNRPPRGPRGTRVNLLPIHRPITFRNVPALKKIIVHSHVRQAVNNSAFLHVASMALQSITNARITVHKSKENIIEWEAKKDKWISVTAELEGEDMYDFLAKTIELVMPRIKDWKGVSGRSGDSVGNISFGLTPEQVALYPEIEFNYGHYPPQMIPGLHVHIQTTALTDKEGRILLMAMGIPFHGDMKKR